MLLNCIVIKEDNSYSSLCPDVDVASEGETLIEAKNNLIEAVSLYIDSAIESHLPIIRTIPDSENPAIISPEIILDRSNIKVNVDVEEYA
ncbi:MAG: hypothetical protein A2X61_04685 [Ignavibacteria bacterium GWB2_35_12]|nr:MAG: hypothetical protein A2X61_04685 [Ignavibacteria bacterium GWB2_35_12]OGU88938.1 MAG: hypothetical protein A2220_06695 [Ignavibacteria bacterium RIFOXYA2_FULL_35_10]OGV24598.1 MAG: hypothetical protein A2475_09260 [Ignavibacteria bacterium RIFOXYC2_FULL_35_21]